uniref:Uncharacterized protein n=1 Tax=Megaviridae environmental sample TaxID=1737588 RepID=A0A5J6VK14_9VIRU|nr:MAG: hypothetical protein [Megaviridae environmental sample]
MDNRISHKDSITNHKDPPAYIPKTIYSPKQKKRVKNKQYKVFQETYEVFQKQQKKSKEKKTKNDPQYMCSTCRDVIDTIYAYCKRIC